MSRKSKFKALYEDIGATETTLLKHNNRRTKKYNKVKNNIPAIEDYNFMCDLLFLPKTKKGFRYLFVIADLASDEFDIEPIKDKNPSTTLKAMQTIFKRKHLNIPYASLKTDNGNEFKSVFHNYLVKHNILHKVALTGRHRDVSVVENLNGTLGKILNTYMNSKEVETGKPFKEWTDIVDIIRERLNKIRKIDNLKPNKYYEPFNPETKKAKFKIGDMVHRHLDEPRNALNEKMSGSVFRRGDYVYDPVPRQVEQTLYFAGDVNYRYIISDFPNTAFAEWELIKSDAIEQSNEIKQIRDKKYNRREKMYYYKIHYFGEKVAQADWMSRNDLIDDIGEEKLEEFIKIYDDKQKKKKN